MRANTFHKTEQVFSMPSKEGIIHIPLPQIATMLLIVYPGPRQSIFAWRDRHGRTNHGHQIPFILLLPVVHKNRILRYEGDAQEP